MFGTFLWATNPSVIKDKLEQVGISKRILNLMNGASILNNGYALVTYVLIVEEFPNQPLGELDVFKYIVRVVIGGIILGIVSGFIISLWLKRISHEPVLKTNVTVLGAYFVYYLAEYSNLNVSRIIALVSWSLFISRTRTAQINRESELMINHVWDQIHFVAQTFTFCFSGVIFSVYILDKESLISGKDYINWVIMFFMLYFIRLVISLIMKLPLSWVGHRINWREAALISHWSVQGGVSLALGISVVLDQNTDEKVGYLLCFHLSGVCILTLLINGFTIQLLAKILRFRPYSAACKKYNQNVIGAYREELKMVIDKLKQNRKNFSYVNSKELYRVGGGYELEDYIKNNQGRRAPPRMLDETQSASYHWLIVDESEYDEDDYLEAKYRCLLSIRSIYLDLFDRGQLSLKAVVLLIETSAISIDDMRHPIRDFQTTLDYLRNSWTYKLWGKLKKYDQLCFEYEVGSNYIYANSELLKIIRKIITNTSIIDKLEDEIGTQIRTAK